MGCLPNTHTTHKQDFYSSNRVAVRCKCRDFPDAVRFFLRQRRGCYYKDHFVDGVRMRAASRRDVSIQQLFVPSAASAETGGALR